MQGFIYSFQVGGQHLEALIAIANGTANVPKNVPNLATMFNVSEKTIKRDLYVLRDMKLIKYVGSNKTGHWEVID